MKNLAKKMSDEAALMTHKNHLHAFDRNCNTFCSQFENHQS